jgi:hypothetical protein
MQEALGLDSGCTLSHAPWGAVTPPLLTLHRVARRPDGCYGVLLHHVGDSDAAGTPFAVTLERTFGSELDVTIPVGEWRCHRSFFYRGGYSTYEIEVPGHSRVLFHRGNVETDSEGCVLVAEEFGVLKQTAAVLNSGHGFMEFLQHCGGREAFELRVLEPK